MKTLRLILSLAALCLLSFSCKHTSVQTNRNQFIPWETGKTPEEGVFWPQGQALPHFAPPAEVLDGLSIAGRQLSDTEKVMFSCLQGLVNKTKPRIFLFDDIREGKYKWPDQLGLNIKEYSLEEKWDIVRKYRKEIAGIVLYSKEHSEHYKNLATTIGGLKNALPVTQKEQDELKKEGIDLPVVVDLTGLTYTTPVEIYEYLYSHYWKDCTKRLLLSHSPRTAGYIRDIGIATGAAVVRLDPRKKDENIVIRKFLNDMKAGESIILGWWDEERSGIGIGVQYGISTIPADYYENATVYSGMPHLINYPVIPKKPKLENKIYLAVFLSDGDNIQYCQHAMSQLWDNEGRGSVPINWTVSPGLPDIGPGLLNYYYKTATPNDFFASGPSGLGYALIYDAHNYVWNAETREMLDPYTRFTQQYLEKSGLRVITIWDQINEEQMDTYATNCRYLYGMTQQDWERQKGKIPAFNKQNKLAFIPNLPCYANSVEVIYRFWEDQIKSFDGTRPLFLSAQGESWKMGPENIVKLKDSLNRLSPGNIVICRGDHFFALYNEAHKMNFNLTLSDEMEITSSPTATQAAFAADGTPSGERKWISEGEGEKWIRFDFKNNYRINRYVIRHAGADGMDSGLNTRSFQLEVSKDSINWTLIDRQKNNKLSVSDIDISPVEARYVRLVILDPGKDHTARIGDIEIYGSAI